MITDYTIKYSRRKTLGLMITKTAAIEVRAPIGTSKKIIESFVKENQDWVDEHYGTVREKVEKREAFQLNFENDLLFLGKSYPLMPIEEARSGFDGQRFYAYAHLIPAELKSNMVEIYRNLAKKVLDHQVKKLSTHMRLKPQAVKINGAKTRWGSCSSKGSLNFSWYLVMAEEDTVRYVVVHELAHLIEMNHSRNFWKIVEQVLPDYQQEKEKLKKLQKTLSVQNWE